MIVTVAALRTELLFAPRPRLRVGVGEEGGGRLRGWLEQHEPTGALIVGFAGATRAALGAGTLVLADEIRGDGSGSLPLDPVLVARARDALRGAPVGPVASVPKLAGPAEKARLGLEVLAVDMESAALGRELARRGIPFLVVRAILDELWEDVSGFPICWVGRALACARALSRAAAVLRPVLEER